MLCYKYEDKRRVQSTTVELGKDNSPSSFNLMCRAKKVSNLINHPVVCLFGTRVGVHVLRWSSRGSN